MKSDFVPFIVGPSTTKSKRLLSDYLYNVPCRWIPNQTKLYRAPAQRGRRRRRRASRKVYRQNDETEPAFCFFRRAVDLGLWLFSWSNDLDT